MNTIFSLASLPTLADPDFGVMDFFCTTCQEFHEPLIEESDPTPSGLIDAFEPLPSPSRILWSADSPSFKAGHAAALAGEPNVVPEGLGETGSTEWRIGWGRGADEVDAAEMTVSDHGFRAAFSGVPRSLAPVEGKAEWLGGYDEYRGRRNGPSTDDLAWFAGYTLATDLECPCDPPHGYSEGEKAAFRSGVERAGAEAHERIRREAEEAAMSGAWGGMAV